MLATPDKGSAMTTHVTGLDRPVTDLAHAVVVEIRGHETLRAAATEMAANGVGLLVVRRGGVVVGVVGERDVVMALADGANPDEVRVDEVMVDDLAGVRPDATLLHALRAMVHNRVRHVLITTGGTISGILSARDLLAAIAQDD